MSRLNAVSCCAQEAQEAALAAEGRLAPLKHKVVSSGPEAAMARAPLRLPRRRARRGSSGPSGITRINEPRHAMPASPIAASMPLFGSQGSTSTGRCLRTWRSADPRSFGTHNVRSNKREVDPPDKQVIVWRRNESRKHRERRREHRRENRQR